MITSIVIMGVAGCGKSSLGQVVAQAQGLPLIEGDDFHSPDNRAKMSQGIALTDADRAGWLDTLAHQLQAHPQGVVLTCSALKRAYRERLRQACPALHFAYLAISRETAKARVLARMNQHFFHEVQFQTGDFRGNSGCFVFDWFDQQHWGVDLHAKRI